MREGMMSEPILIAVITAAGVVLSALITRAMLTKNHIGWMAMGIFLGAGCMYALVALQSKELVNVALRNR
jgi:Ca2+/Na+ antiporter